MKNVAHTLPFLIRNDNDLIMADLCFRSLANSDPGAFLVLYNQGCLSNENLRIFLNKYNLDAHILGDGHNAGIARGRMACFKYIWDQSPNKDYISEIHVDMIFPKGWVQALVEFLVHNDEPMICSGILTSQGELHPEQKGKRAIQDIPVSNLEQLEILLNSLTSNKVLEGFVHPVIHRAQILKKVGGYDTRFLKGKQGYEDDSLLLGYRYYMGTRYNWKPKCYTMVRVYHATLAQRSTMSDIEKEFINNLQGLIHQYGFKGLMELNEIYKDNLHFTSIARQLLKQIE
ncbi:MAG: hypothetical protein H5T98_10900 [Syntrophomonadaceae bacterium]|nr:hypothetical protein [Syntrophomonadaceae bacterium]